MRLITLSVCLFFSIAVIGQEEDIKPMEHWLQIAFYESTALDYAANGDFEMAIMYIDSSIALYQSPRTLAIKAELYLDMEKPRLAVMEATKIINMEPDSIDQFYALRARAKEESGDYYGTIADYNSAIESNPGVAIYFLHRAGPKWELNDHKGCVNDCLKAIEIDPEFAVAHFTLGIYYIGIDEKEKGCLSLSRAGELGLLRAYDAINDLCN